MSTLWLLFEATSATPPSVPPDWAGWAALLLGPYPLTAYLLYQIKAKDDCIAQQTQRIKEKDQEIEELNRAVRETGNKMLDVILRAK